MDGTDYNWSVEVVTEIFDATGSPKESKTLNSPDRVIIKFREIELEINPVNEGIEICNINKSPDFIIDNEGQITIKNGRS
jgi:hypothetical protein